jgi:hypothetical protein
MTAPVSPAVNALASQIHASIQRSIRDQRTYVETMAEQTIRDGHVHGFIELASSGELVADVRFPISFAEKPLFTYGLEMGDNTWLAQGDFPIHSATVTRYTTQRPADSVIYVGASLGIVVIGAARSILHYSFEGRTFTVPTGTELTIGTPL